ncbi:MAG: leader peptidase (prepilin peptidase) / N-methyltransferase [Actinomycetota bacterium]|nr:leader peptidase (prepilin peptidase) / N-methyltransferase [Actinomycetota bacterium]
MLILGGALAGLLVGSFLNVVILRVPAKESIVTPPSHCRTCDAPVRPRDNLPVVSWLLLRGRARCCGEPIPARYPLVELLTAGAFAGVAAWLGPSWELPAFLYLASISITLAIIDLDTFLLPARIVTPSYAVTAALLGLAAVGAPEPLDAALRAVVGGLALWLLYFSLRLIHPRGMGYGDVRLSGLLGLALAWQGWDCLAVGAFTAFVLGGLGGAVVLLLGKGNLKTEIPYGPYMIVGTWVGLVAGGPIGDWYLGLSGV